MLLMATVLIGAVSCTSDDEVDNGGVQQPTKPTITLDSTTSDFTAERQALTKDFADKVAKKGGEVRYIPLKGYDDNYAHLSPELLEWMFSFRR